MSDSSSRNKGPRAEVPRVVGGRPHPDDHAPDSAELAGSSESFGPGSALLRVGSMGLELIGLDERLTELVERNYRGFLVGSGEEPTAMLGARPTPVRVLRSTRERYLYLPRAEGRSEEARLDARSTPQGLELWSYFFAGSFDRDARSARLLLCDAAEADQTQAIENFLRFLVSAAALRQGGFLLHSAGAVRGESAWLLFGPSGAGKSTALANSPPGSVVLGDDLVLIEPWRDSYRACGVPFRGSFVGDARNSSTHAPVAMACRLFHASDNRLEEVARSVQVAELVGELPFLLDDSELRTRALDCAARFCRTVPVRRLYLRRDGTFWDLLDGQGG